MSEFRLTQCTVLGGSEPRQERIGELEISENAEVALASLAARLNRLLELIGQQFMTSERGLQHPLLGTRPPCAYWLCVCHALRSR